MKISDAMLVSALIKVKNYEVHSTPDDSAINHTFSENFETGMHVLISSFDKKEKSTPFLRSTLIKAAVIIITVCIGIFSLIMINPQVKADFENAVMEFYENYIKFHFVSGDEVSGDFSNYQNIYADYVPKDFTLKEKYDEYEAVGFRYENENENLAYDIYISLNDGLAVHTDKNKNYEKTIISEKEAYLITGENNKKPYSTLIIPGNKITVTIYGNLSALEIINVGKSLKEQ